LAVDPWVAGAPGELFELQAASPPNMTVTRASRTFTRFDTGFSVADFRLSGYKRKALISWLDVKVDIPLS
jgi:hypothetical protein